MKLFRRFSTLLAFCLAAAQAHAQDANVLKDKRLSMILATNVGGGTDATGRLVAQFLTKHLPGQPTIIVRNMGGAGGITAMNFVAQQVAPDGATLIFGSNGVQDPFNYRTPQATYDPAKFQYVAGIGRGGQFLVINKDALPRLFDKTKPPVIMGSVGSIPRSGMQVTAWAIEYLGWNAKWVTGYPGTNELMFALQRGEIDMTATANFYQVDEMVRSGKFRVVIQSGTLTNGKVLPRPEFSDAPVFATAMEGKVTDPIAKQAFDYYTAINTIDKWLGLPPATPSEVTRVYRDAFAKMAADEEFLERGTKISEDFTPMPHDDVEGLVQKLAATTPEAVKYINALLRKQGLQVTD
jgi:tripartite-type tricarboxylate transporter receptor subunit TctC